MKGDENFHTGNGNSALKLAEKARIFNVKSCWEFMARKM